MARGGATSIPAVGAQKSRVILAYPVLESSMCITLDGDSRGWVSCAVRAAHATFNARYGVLASIASRYSPWLLRLCALRFAVTLRFAEIRTSSQIAMIAL